MGTAIYGLGADAFNSEAVLKYSIAEGIKPQGSGLAIMDRLWKASEKNISGK